MAHEDWTLGRVPAALLATLIAALLWLCVHLERAAHDASVVEATRAAEQLGAAP